MVLSTIPVLGSVLDVLSLAPASPGTNNVINYFPSNKLESDSTLLSLVMFSSAVDNMLTGPNKDLTDYGAYLSNNQPTAFDPYSFNIGIAKAAMEAQSSNATKYLSSLLLICASSGSFKLISRYN
jgi:hypothetical protein